MERERTPEAHTWLGMAVPVSMVAAGLLHLIVAPQHWEHAPPHGVTLATIGLAQIVWAGAFWRRRLGWLLRIGIVLAGGSFVLWGVTRVFPAPFHDGPEPVEILDVLIKLAELATIAGLSSLLVLGTSSREPHASGWRKIGWSLLVAVLVGVAAYGISLLGEFLFSGFDHADDGHD